MHLMMVENDPRAAENIGSYLKLQRPDIRIHALRGNEHDVVEQCDASDIVLLDMHLIPQSGPELCRQLRAINDHTPVLGMTCIAMEYYLDEITAAGAQGLIQKEQLISMPKLIELLVHGGAMRGFRTARDAHTAIVEEMNQTGEATLHTLPPLSNPLTPQEQETFALMRQYGADSAAIAAHMGLSASTVRGYMRNIAAKYGVGSPKNVVRLLLNGR
ncbi:two component transcriptional regulator, LuxR family [Bifidobacterium italicum]|uniref:Two component transcriptional regulator, LuxR family n=1 Tax=Bifidobacterium italicum TaxID=1960968 RepID=A0A2A2EKE7_9BIFI|nr:response regulator [Bifidobacterium italicum]PAU69467.1 two component transcriptional regulator, LuxR family [Bifidobacterium italicum]